MSELHEYTEEFFEYIERGSIASGKRFAAFIVPLLGVKSVLDVGCGRGAWLREWQNAGASLVHGIDGPYVQKESLLIPAEDFTAIDLSKAFALGRRYDLVTCLEVAEHIPRSTSETFISSLVAHSDLILFSAATPGQGGENHINERPLSFWQRAFAVHGYVAFDAIRPQFVRDQCVEPWYKFNSVLYVSSKRIPTLPDSLLRSKIEATSHLREIGDWKWRARRALLRFLPTGTVTTLSKWNYRRLNRAFRRRSATAPDS
jgi:hypothetical protein